MEDSFFSISSTDDRYSREIPDSTTDGGKIRFSIIPYCDAMIVSMNHPASITIKNYVSIKVLSGSVSVFGYTMNAGSTPLKALSLKTTGLVQIKTESSDRIWEPNKEYIVMDLKRKLQMITRNSKRTQNILNKMENSTAVICIRSCVFPTNLQLLEFYFPKLLKSEESSSDKHDNKTIKSDCIESTYSPIEFGLDEEKLISDISTQIRSAKLGLIDAPRIVVFGSRDTGKSTLIRYLINRILSNTLVAYYLDADPGQSEFTPPGGVSLNTVSEAIIGPPFCHQQAPTTMIFTGDISVSSIAMYTSSVSKLMQLYTEKYKNEPLFVNTMGWIQGLGLSCLRNVLKIVNPTILVELVNDDVAMIDYRDFVSQDIVYHMIASTHGQKNSHPAKSMREFSIISYLGKGLLPYTGAMPVNKIRPVCVSWDKIAMYMFNKQIQPWRLLESFSLGIVALCAVSESSILVSEKEDIPMTLEEDPENECIGFGLVRAIDEDKHLFYIVTPLALHELKRVNALMKGNIMIPNIVLLKQGIEGTPLPYLKDVMPAPPNEVEMEGISTQAGESASNLLTAELYGKSVPKRYGRKR